MIRVVNHTGIGTAMPERGEEGKEISEKHDRDSQRTLMGNAAAHVFPLAIISFGPDPRPPSHTMPHLVAPRRESGVMLG